MAAILKTTEFFDHRALHVIVDNWDNLPVAAWESHCQRPLSTILKEYLRKAVCKSPRGEAAVEYAPAKGRKDGRMFAKGSLSLQCMFREVRNTIARDYYHDVDMANAHPVILRQFCDKRGIPCPVLASYIDRRDTKLAKIVARNPGTDRAFAKKVVLAIMNGGKADYNSLRDPPKWLAAFKLEVEAIHAAMINDPAHANLVKSVADNKDKDYLNIAGSVCNRVLCAVENEMLMACVEFVKSKGVAVENVVLVFDGLMVPRGKVTIDDSFLADMSAFVLSKTGYSVTMVEKPMDEVLDLTGLTAGRREQVCETDLEGAQMFLEIIRGKAFRCYGELYVLTQDRTWTNSSKMVRTTLNREALFSNILKAGSHGAVPFSATLNGRNVLVELVQDLIPDDSMFTERLFTQSLRKVFFQDGVYDFQQRCFREETEDDMTDRRIPRPFPERDEAKMAEVRDRVLMTIFANRMDVKCYLEHVARAMAGELEDKHWVILLGFRSCGKGVLSGLNENAWSKYVTSVSSESFLMQRSSDGDEYKKLSWLLDCVGARMILTQEIAVDACNKDKKINGNLIKGKLSSGGDTVKARKNYSDREEFRIQGRLFMALNDIPPVTPADTFETMHLFNFPNQFVDQLREDSLPHMKLGDPGIKAYCRQQATIDAFVWLVIDAYNDFPVIKSEAVRIETDLFRHEGGDEWAAIKDLFEITGSSTDAVSFKEVAEVIKEAGVNVSKQMTRKRLEVLGCKYTNHAKVDGKECRGFTGLKVVDRSEEA